MRLLTALRRQRPPLLPPRPRPLSSWSVTGAARADRSWRITQAASIGATFVAVGAFARFRLFPTAPCDGASSGSASGSVARIAALDKSVAVILDLDRNGVCLDRTALAALVAQRTARLETLRSDLKAAARAAARDGVGPVFRAVSEDRVPHFSKWYFSYTTTYSLMGEAFKAAALASVKPFGSTDARTAVRSRLEELLFDKYLHLALRPELNDAPLRSAFQGTVLQVRGICGETRRRVEEKSRVEVDEEKRTELAPYIVHCRVPSLSCGRAVVLLCCCAVVLSCCRKC